MFSEKELNQAYWETRWENGETGWDIGTASSPLKEYFEQVAQKEAKILIPGCGNAHEAAFLIEAGFTDLTLLDISPTACRMLIEKFGTSVKVCCEDFFEHEGRYDIIVEQTFFCALEPQLRERYVEKMHQLLTENGRLVGVLFNRDFGAPFPPFGGSLEEYRSLFKDRFQIKVLEPCYNSIAPRENSEVFAVFVKEK